MHTYYTSYGLVFGCIRSSRQSVTVSYCPSMYNTIQGTPPLFQTPRKKKKKLPAGLLLPFSLHLSIFHLSNFQHPPTSLRILFSLWSRTIADSTVFSVPSVTLDPFLPAVAVVVKDSQPLLCRVPHPSITSKGCSAFSLVSLLTSLQATKNERSWSPIQNPNLCI